MTGGSLPRVAMSQERQDAGSEDDRAQQIGENHSASRTPQAVRPRSQDAGGENEDGTGKLGPEDAVRPFE